MLFNQISIDPKICHGQACIKGTRIPAHQIVGMLANGDTFDSLLKAYPTITREDIRACCGKTLRQTSSVLPSTDATKRFASSFD